MLAAYHNKGVISHACHSLKESFVSHLSGVNLQGISSLSGEPEHPVFFYCVVPNIGIFTSSHEETEERIEGSHRRFQGSA